MKISRQQASHYHDHPAPPVLDALGISPNPAGHSRPPDVDTQHHASEKRRSVFPEENCVLLPVENATAELIARCIADELVEACNLNARDENGFTGLEIAVDENEGQWGICRSEF